MIWTRSDQQAATENAFGALGMMIANDNAITAGAGSLLGPISNEDSDSWFVHQFWTAQILFQSGIGLHGSTLNYQMEFDSKGQRKISEGDGVAVLVENAGTSGAVAVLKFRLLFKLH